MTKHYLSENEKLKKEWHPTKNGDLTPHEVTCGCTKKVWWKCLLCGRSWEGKICNRTKTNMIGCCSCKRQLEKK